MSNSLRLRFTIFFLLIAITLFSGFVYVKKDLKYKKILNAQIETLQKTEKEKKQLDQTYALNQENIEKVMENVRKSKLEVEDLDHEVNQEIENYNIKVKNQDNLILDVLKSLDKKVIDKHQVIHIKDKTITLEADGNFKNAESLANLVTGVTAEVIYNNIVETGQPFLPNEWPAQTKAGDKKGSQAYDQKLGSHFYAPVTKNIDSNLRYEDALKVLANVGYASGLSDNGIKKSANGQSYRSVLVNGKDELQVFSDGSVYQWR